MPLTVSSVHIPSAMKDLSVRGWGKKKYDMLKQIQEYACKHKVSFTKAYSELASELCKRDK